MIDIQLESVSFSKISPPTHFYTNEFSFVFQVITDTYGIPTYKEANPSVISSITFPFFFGIMFGDIGHGSIIMIFGLLITFFSDHVKQLGIPALKSMLHAKYLIIMMGFFATYMGFIYNDFMSLPTRVFDSCYPIEEMTKPESIHQKDHKISELSQ